MALYKQADFAKKCGVTNAYVSVNKKRGKVIFTSDGYIDDSEEENIYFMQKCIDKLSKESNELESKPAQSDADNKKSTKKSEEKKDGGVSKSDLDRIKKELDIEKVKVDTRLQELKEQKIRGEVIPFVLVKQVLVTHTQSIVTSQKDSIEYLLINFSKEAKLTGAQLAKLRGTMVEHLNDAVEKSVNVSKRNIKVLMEEFSIKKEVGEHE